MKIKYVEIENILSIKSLRLEFGDSGLILLDGWNYDDDTANGAGKTAVLNSLSYGIFGKFPRKISAADILRSGTKTGYVKVGLDVAGSLYEISRARPNNLKFYVDGVEKDMTQEEFESRIRMTYSQYLISMYSAQTEGLKLISLNDSGKKDFFLQLMNLDAFEECRNQLTTTLSIMYTQEKVFKNEISILETRIATYEESKTDISALDKRDAAAHLGYVQELIELKKLDRPDTDKLDMLKSKIDEEISNLHDLENEYRNKKSHVQQHIYKKELLLSSMKENSAVCNKCGNTVCMDARDYAAEIKTLGLDIENVTKTLTDYPDFAVEKLKYKQMLDKCKTKRSVILDEYASSMVRVSWLEKEIVSFNRIVDAISDATIRNRQIDIKISNTTVSLLELEYKLKNLVEDVKLNESVQALFSPTGAPAYVLDSAVDVFNDKVYQYASLIWPNASYVLQSFKENKSGEVKAKFSEKLSINGKDRSIGALSGGEYRCLSLAVDFAVIDVLETMFGISINPIMLDEPFESLDNANRERVLELLEKVAISRQIWVVDHSSEAKAMFSNVIRIEKRSGVSSLVI